MPNRSRCCFNVFRVLASLLHRHRSTEVNETLHDVWPSPSWYIFGGSCTVSCNGILPGPKFTASKSCVLLYWQRYCTALEQWAAVKLSDVLSSPYRAAIQFDIGRSNSLVSSFFSSHNLSHRRLDVCHTSTHGVALVRI